MKNTYIIVRVSVFSDGEARNGVDRDFNVIIPQDQLHQGSEIAVSLAKPAIRNAIKEYVENRLDMDLTEAGPVPVSPKTLPEIVAELPY